MLAVSIVFVISLYFLDRYEKEPPLMLLTAFLLGMTATFVVILLKKWFLPESTVLLSKGSPLFRAFVVAAFFEEIVKLGILLGVFYKRRDFSEPMDGVIYGAFIGAGFAYVENILYTAGVALPAYMSGEKGAYTHALLWMTAVRSIPGHIIFDAIGGYFIGMAKFTWNKSIKREYILKGIISAFFLHGLFDFLLMEKLNSIFFFVFLPLSLAWAGYLLIRAWRLSPYNPKVYAVLNIPEEGLPASEENSAAWAYLLIFMFPVVAYALFLLLLIGTLK